MTNPGTILPERVVVAIRNARQTGSVGIFGGRYIGQHSKTRDAA